MADSINVERAAHQRLAASGMGWTLGPQQPRYMQLGVKTQGAEGDVLNLPAAETCGPIQDLDTSSPTFGQFYFLVGYDSPGSSAPIQ